MQQFAVRLFCDVNGKARLIKEQKEAVSDQSMDLFYTWPTSCEKEPSDMCKKCRPRPAAASDQGLHFLTLVTSMERYIFLAAV